MAFRENAGRQRSAFGRFQTYLIRLKALSSLEYIYIYIRNVAFSSSLDKGDLTGPINYYRSMVDPDTMGEPGKMVSVPTLLIWGAEDKFLNISMAHHSAKYVLVITLCVCRPIYEKRTKLVSFFLLFFFVF